MVIVLYIVLLQGSTTLIPLYWRYFWGDDGILHSRNKVL